MHTDLKPDNIFIGFADGNALDALAKKLETERLKVKVWSVGIRYTSLSASMALPRSPGAIPYSAIWAKLASSRMVVGKNIIGRSRIWSDHRR